jgi:hypothetical protein
MSNAFFYQLLKAIFTSPTEPTDIVDARILNDIPDRSKGGGGAHRPLGPGYHVEGKASRARVPSGANEEADAKTYRKSAPRRATISPTFKLVFLTATVITIAAGATSVALALSWPTTTPNQQSVFEAMGFAWKAGLGAIFGLLGGKLA